VKTPVVNSSRAAIVPREEGVPRATTRDEIIVAGEVGPSGTTVVDPVDVQCISLRQLRVAADDHQIVIILQGCAPGKLGDPVITMQSSSNGSIRVAFECGIAIR
jgi:hypothetical protein